MGTVAKDGRRRCAWAGDDEQYVAYHDTEWGVPHHGDAELFELLTLEGAQAGLSWLTILRRRDGYRRVFAQFDPLKVSRISDRKVEQILLDSGIVRNRLKVTSVITNARAILQIQKGGASLDSLLWEVGVGSGDAMIAARAMRKLLAERGFKFVGPTICLSLMQASGMVNHHEKTCFRYSEITNAKTARVR